MNDNGTYDPWDDGANPEIRQPEYFGQIIMDMWPCVLEKGRGKVPFDPQQHDPNKRVTAIKFDLIPLPEHNYSKRIAREVIAESKEWAGTILTSLKNAWPAEWGNFSLRTINNRYGKVMWVPTGQTYQDKTSGETKNSLTLKVLALYKDEAACRAAYLMGNGHSTPAPAPTEPVIDYGPAVTQQPVAQPAVAPVNKERETALQFVGAIIKQEGGNPDKVAEKIASIAMIAKHFNIASPEVTDLLFNYQPAK
jgi:hypothetical protein